MSSKNKFSINIKNLYIFILKNQAKIVAVETTSLSKSLIITLTNPSKNFADYVVI